MICANAAKFLGGQVKVTKGRVDKTAPRAKQRRRAGPKTDNQCDVTGYRMGWAWG